MLVIWLSVSCFHFDDDHDIHISVSENENTYKMSAHFARSKTKAVHEYMDKKLGYPNNVSFVNNEIDATLTLQDKTTFYIKSYPGEIELKLDKEKNSYEAYRRVKEMCEGIKSVVADK
jgi:hypothetical protein